MGKRKWSDTHKSLRVSYNNSMYNGNLGKLNFRQYFRLYGNFNIFTSHEPIKL